MGSMAERPDERFLVEKARRGDFEPLFRAFERPVFTLVRRILGRTEEAEEAVQETFLEVFKSLPSLRNGGALWPWIRSVASSKALMALRRRRLEEEPLPEESAPEMEDPVPAFDWKTLDLEKALGALPPLSRAVLWLHDVEGLTHGEIARLMGTTPSFSKSRLARAHRRLREVLAAQQKGGSACTSA